MTDSTWLEILVRMCAGEASEDPFIGVLEVVGASDDGELSPVRVFKDRDRYRVESVDGRLLTIRRADRTWEFGDEGEPPVRIDNAGGYRHVARGVHGSTIQRRPANGWDDDDFTTPTGPPRPVSYLGRDAWEVELAPPVHKESALVLTIDARTGMVMQERSVLFGLLSRWTEITPVAAHADELFEWTGEECHRWFETRELTDEEVVELEREREERVAALGIGPLTVSLPVELHPYGEDELGTIGLSARMDGLLERRPRSDEPWDEVSQHVHVERWSDDSWDWLIGTDEHPEVLAEIRRQLVEPRLDEG